jgi:triosephosphate isomerase
MSPTEGRRPFIAGNWKMHKTADEAESYINDLKNRLGPASDVDVGLAPAFPALERSVKAAAGSPIIIAAQNLHFEPEGAYTGEVSAKMLTSLGVTQVIIGHSERRQYFGETNQTVNQRAQAALNAGLKLIVCIGETLQERENGQTFSVLQAQVNEGLAGLNVTPETLTVAYEPVWAIGTGKTATPDMAQEAHAYVRELLKKQFGDHLAAGVRIQYGGSVKPENAAELMAQPDIDGGLVGGASLKPEIFIDIIHYK